MSETMRQLTRSTSNTSWTGKIGRRSSRLRGNAVLDLALVMPVLLALTFGAMEYGYALYLKHTLQGAAREGARAAVVAGATATDVQTAVDNAMNAAGFAQAKYVRPPAITAMTSTTPATAITPWTSAPMGAQITVTVTANWGTAGVHVLPTYLMGIPTTKNISGATTMRKEG
jgi:Flp pilus assembly protein TadG